MPDYKYYSIRLRNIKATIGFDFEKKEAKTLECSNMESCYKYKFLERGKCPYHCQAISEFRKYALRGRIVNADIHEIDGPADIKNSSIFGGEVGTWRV